MTDNTSAHDLRVYRITIRGRVDEELVEAYCPAGTVLTSDGDTASLANIRADQAGIVGLVRHLHNLGLTILALESQEIP